jgi:hypothetical protein
MTYKQPDFQPVLPNITDDSMRDVDVDTETVKRQNDARHKFSTKTKKVEPDKSTRDEGSMGRKIIIGILVVVIIVLIILLIYQIYKYYNVEEILPSSAKPYNISPIHIPNNSEHQTKENRPGASDVDNQDHMTDTIPSDGGIPEHVRNLDNDILSQYVKKGGNAYQQRQKHVEKEPNNARHVGHNSMVCDTNENTPISEMDRIGKIIDDARESQMTSTDTNNENIPSREDNIIQIKEDMDIDRMHTTVLHDIEEDHGDNVINTFLADDNYDNDNDSNKSEYGGCQFELLKGKNRGLQCGCKRVTDTRCIRHKDK